MPFIPHTKADVDTMLDAIGVDAIEELFDEIPEALRAGELKQVPEGRSEMDMLALLAERASPHLSAELLGEQSVRGDAARVGGRIR